jgi:hypothetical protein
MTNPISEPLSTFDSWKHRQDISNGFCSYGIYINLDKSRLISFSVEDKMVVLAD